MKRFIDLQKSIMVQILLALLVGCTSIGPVPSPTVPVLTEAVLALSSIPSTETPSISTATATPTTTGTLSNTAVPTFTLSPTATVCATPSNGITYTIQPGDNLNQIALRYNMSAEELQRANCLPSADTIFAGQIIYVPFYIPPVLFQPTSAPPASAQTVIPPDLKGEISMDLGGEPSPVNCPYPAQALLPEIKLSDRVKDFFQLCIYGFPLGQTIDIKLSPRHDPDFSVSTKKDVVDQYTFADGRKTTVVKIFLWAPVGLTPDWTVSVPTTVGNEIKAEITFAPFAVRATNIVPDVKINPFVFQWCDSLSYSYSYKTGDVMYVRGTNFDPEVYVSVGFYREMETGPFPLIRPGKTAKTDKLGNFEARFEILPSDPTGKIWVISTTDRSIPTPADSSTPTPMPYRAADQDVKCFHIIRS
jgi:LysM repeat protein